MADIPVSIFRTSAVRSGTQPSNPAEVEGVTFPPVNPPGSGNATLYKLLGDTTDKDFIGKNGFVPVVNSENFLTLEPLPNALQDGLISGGIVQWTGTGYQFNVSSALARFQGVFPLQSAFDILTLTAADATNPRIDLFILQILFDGDGIPNGMEADFITGTPAATPAKPQIDPATQIELTQVLVPALSTTPTLTDEIVYDENTEWTGTSSGTGTANFSSAVNPYVGTVSVETTNIQNGFYIQFNNGSEIDRNDYQTLGLFLDLKASMPANQNIYITFLNGSLAPVSGFTLLNFDKSSTIYQFIGIALSSISFTSDLFQYIRFSFVRTGGSPTYSGYFLDLVKFEGGINPPVQFGSFLSLSDTPSSYSGQGGKSVAVKADETGLEFVTPSLGGVQSVTGDGVDNTDPDNPVIVLADIATSGSPYDLDQGGATDGQVLTWVAANSRYEPVTPSGGADTNAVHYNVADGKTATEKQQARDNIGLDTGIPQIVATTGTINNLAKTSNFIKFTGVGAVTLTGIVADSDGAEVSIQNETGSTITFYANDILSTAGNRFDFAFVLPDDQIFTFRYNGTDSIWSLKYDTWTPIDVGVYRNSQVAIGRTTLGGSNAALAINALGSDAGFPIFLGHSFAGTQVCNIDKNGFFGSGLNPTTCFEATRSTTGTLTQLILRQTGTAGIAGASFINSASKQAWIGVTSPSYAASLGNFFFVALLTTGTDIVIAPNLASGSGGTEKVWLRCGGLGSTNNVASFDLNGLTFNDAKNIIFNTTTGTKIGTATSQKLAFWNKTPIIQPTTGITAADFVANSSGIANDTATYGGYTMGQIAAALINMGALA